MPGENKKTKKAGPVKPGAAKKAQQTRVKRKVAKAVRNSDAVVDKYIEDLQEGKETDRTLALITRVDGGGRFQAFDFVVKVVLPVKVSKGLSTKKAKHRNAIIPIAVRVDSYVILDGSNQIKAVVGESDAAHIRRLLHVQEEQKENDLFNRGQGKPAASAAAVENKGYISSNKTPEVNLNDL